MTKEIINNITENKYYYKNDEIPRSSDETIDTLVTQKQLKAYVTKPLIAKQGWNKISSEIVRTQNTPNSKK